MAHDGAYHHFEEDDPMQQSVFMSDRSVRFDTLQLLDACRALLPTPLPSSSRAPAQTHNELQVICWFSFNACLSALCRKHNDPCCRARIHRSGEIWIVEKGKVLFLELHAWGVAPKRAAR